MPSTSAVDAGRIVERGTKADGGWIRADVREIDCLSHCAVSHADGYHGKRKRIGQCGRLDWN